MRAIVLKWLDIFIESVNYILIHYALSNMAMLLKRNALYILFFASELWLMTKYWKRLCKLTENKLISTVLLIGCFAIHIGMLYFVGRIVGTVVPFRQS